MYECVNLFLPPAAATVATPNFFSLYSLTPMISEDCHTEVKIKLRLPKQRALYFQLQF